MIGPWGEDYFLRKIAESLGGFLLEGSGFFWVVMCLEDGEPAKEKICKRRPGKEFTVRIFPKS